MIKYFKIFILLISVTSCLEEKPKDNIKYPPIKEREFQTLIKKIWLVNAHLYNNKKFTQIPRDSVGSITNKLLEDYGYKKEDFKKSIKYYSENPRLLDSIIKDLRDSLEKVFTGISHDVNEDDQILVQQDSLKNILKESSKFIDNMKFEKDLKPSIKSKNQILDTLKIKK
ncbi:MAG: DUF4296 domain-containing protein [Flavobacteriales bacterium]|nr:DUF4296 domain-containing protein [Flavobacteriales bacterium]